MKRFWIALITLLLIVTLTACSAAPSTASAAPAATAAAAVNTAQSTATTNKVSNTTTATPSATVTPHTENAKTHEAAEDYTWDAASVISIQLNGSGITASNAGVSIDGSKATITAGGTYSLSGTLDNGQVIVDSKDKKTVRLILNGITINNSTSAPIVVSNAEKVIVVLADNTQNTLTDAKTYAGVTVANTAENNEPNAALFSKADLTIYGNGSLTVNANYQDGIASKDGLIIASGTLTVNAADEGIRGKDYLVVKKGTLTVNAAGDGLKSDNDTDGTKGYILIEAGTFKITSTGDALSAQTDVTIKNGEFTLSSGGGSSKKVSGDASAKGIKGTVSVEISNGTFTIDSADDSIHSNNSVKITGGTFQIASADDGVHSDTTLEISGGIIRVVKSYEGIESAAITINSGEIYVVSSDDGINGAGGNDGSGGALPGGMQPGGMRGGGRMPGGAQPGAAPAQDTFTASSAYSLNINGGYIVVDANGDGVDVNGSITMTNGTLLVNGPTENMNGALDYDSQFKVTGGVVVAAGSSGMAQAPSTNSTQNSVLINLTSVQAAGTLIRIQNSQGEDIATFAPTKQYQSVVVSSPKLIQGQTYTVYTGGSSTGTVKNSLVEGGTYTPGTKVSDFTVSSVVTQVGTASRMR